MKKFLAAVGATVLLVLLPLSLLFGLLAIFVHAVESLWRGFYNQILD